MRRKTFATLVVIIYFVFLGVDFILAATLTGSSTVSITATVPAPYIPPVTPPSGGGGGGGGGITPPTTDTRVIFSGMAYPLSRITVMKNSVMAVSSLAGPDAIFNITITDLEAGWINFLVYADDANGNHSSSYSLPIYVTRGAITTVTGVFVSPTINIDKPSVMYGEPVKVFGQSAPNSTVTIIVNSTTENNFNTKADGGGWYFYTVDTNILNIGDHQAKSKSNYNGLTSPYSSDAPFKVTDKAGTVPAATSTSGFYKPPVKPGGGSCGVVADVNSDCKINLVDFSILAYWYKRPKPPVRLDLKKNGKIDLSDFSIMAYYWTG